jgi:hypothetical protein
MLSLGDDGWYSIAGASSNSLSSSPSVSKISVASDSGRGIDVRGELMGYVFARKKALPFRSLGDMGVVACMAAVAVGVGPVQFTMSCCNC